MLYDHTIKPAPVTKPRCCDAEAGVFTRGAVGITPGGRECSFGWTSMWVVCVFEFLHKRKVQGSAPGKRKI